MTSGVTAKVRLVKCPKCRQLLPELPDHPVYKCGGCGTILQAKNTKNDVQNRKSGLHEPDVPQTNTLDLVAEDKESGSSSHKDLLPSLAECYSVQNSEGDQRKSEDCNTEQLEHLNLSSEGHNNEQDQSSCWNYKRDELGGSNLSNHDQSNDVDTIESRDCNIKQAGHSNEVCLSTEPAPHDNDESSPIAGPNSEVKANDEGLQLTGVNSEVDIKDDDSNFRSSASDNMVASTGSTYVAAHHMPARESISSELPKSPYEQLEQRQKSVHAFDYLRSTDTIETTEFANPSSELRDMSISPTNRSHYAYEGSVSSYDGIDDQFPERHLRSSRSTYNVASFTLSKERHKKNGILSSSKKHAANKYSKWDQDELLESRTQGRPVTNWKRRDTQNYPSGVPFYGRGYIAGYENGSPAYQVHNQFLRNSSFQSYDNSDYDEQDKMKLLRIVSELQDELNKRCYLYGKAEERFSSWKEKQIPSCYDHEAPEEEFLNDSNYPRFPGRGRLGSHSIEQCDFSRIPFSGEATSSSHEVYPAYLHCHPQHWQSSSRLPSQSIPCNNKGLCRLHPGVKFCDSCKSCPSTPQRYVDSEFPVCSRGTKSEEQRHKEHYLKKQYLAKRHFRPIAGGAPIITCYNCLSPLQLPADFLLFRKRIHWLRCGACLELLKFSLKSRTHLLPYALNAINPPPSEVEDNSDAIDRRLVSASHVNASPYADPVSCSDDYELSYCKSCSTEGDPVPSTSFNALQGTVGERNMSYDPSKPIGQGDESVLKQSQKKHENFVEKYVTAGSSSNASKAEKSSAEIETRSSSPLHRLMGYSSPSEVINGSIPFGTGRKA